MAAFQRYCHKSTPKIDRGYMRYQYESTFRDKLPDKVRLNPSPQQRLPGPSEPEKWSGQGAPGEDSTHVRRAQATQPWPFFQARDSRPALIYKARSALSAYALATCVTAFSSPR